MTYAIYALCGVSVLQCVALIVLLKRRRDLDLARIETRLSHFAEALALLTDTTQSGFASVAAELERGSLRKTPGASRAATSKRIVSAARKGRSIQDIAAQEEISESEIRLTLGLAEELMESPAEPELRTAARASRTGRSAAAAPAARAMTMPPPAAPARTVTAVAHETTPKTRPTRRVGNTLNLGA